MSTKIVYGDYAIANKVGQFVGFATQDDFAISEIGDDENKKVDGATAQEIYSDHGLQATGTVVLTDAQVATHDMRGKVIMVSKNGGTWTRPFVVDSWDVSNDTDTGGAVASVTAHSYDSMVDEYLIGPRDPDTGEPLSGKTVCTLTVRFDSDSNLANCQGATIGIFPTSYSYDASAAPDMTQAIATGKLVGANVSLVVAKNVSCFIAGVTASGWIYQTGAATDDTTTADVFSATQILTVETDASDSASASA